MALAVGLISAGDLGKRSLSRSAIARGAGVAGLVEGELEVAWLDHRAAGDDQRPAALGAGRGKGVGVKFLVRAGVRGVDVDRPAALGQGREVQLAGVDPARREVGRPQPPAQQAGGGGVDGLDQQVKPLAGPHPGGDEPQHADHRRRVAGQQLLGAQRQQVAELLPAHALLGRLIQQPLPQLRGHLARARAVEPDHQPVTADQPQPVVAQVRQRPDGVIQIRRPGVRRPGSRGLGPRVVLRAAGQRQACQQQRQRRDSKNLMGEVWGHRAQRQQPS